MGSFFVSVILQKELYVFWLFALGASSRLYVVYMCICKNISCYIYISIFIYVRVCCRSVCVCVCVCVCVSFARSFRKIFVCFR